MKQLKMKLQAKPNKWSCYPAAWAMAIGMAVDKLIGEIGHDGSEVAFPEYHEPMNRRGFHSQEMICIALHRGLAPVPIELYPVLSPNNKAASSYVKVTFCKDKTNLAYFDHVVINEKGVIECMTNHGHKHAVAFEKGEIFDPEGEQYSYENLPAHGLHPMKLWRMHRV